MNMVRVDLRTLKLTLSDFEMPLGFCFVSLRQQSSPSLNKVTIIIIISIIIIIIIIIIIVIMHAHTCLSLIKIQAS